MTNSSESKHIELKKHINAIHCTNNMTLIQRKLVNALLFHAYHDLPTKLVFEIPAKKLCELIGYNSHDYLKLKQALKSLMSTIIEWNVIDYTTSTTDKWRASTILAAARLEGGICTYEYSSTLKELLYRPEMYGRINMQIQSQFSSSYALALYENCVRYRGLSQTPWFTLETFRKLMGVSDDKYENFKDLRKRVLNIAIKEVNVFSDVVVEPELKKANKKVISIRFKLFERVNESVEKIKVDNIDTDLADTLISQFGISPEVTKDILKNYEPIYIKEKIKITLESASFKKGKITGLAGYLIKALRDDYQPLKSSEQQFESQKSSVRQTEKVEEEGLLESLKLKKRYEQYINEQIDKYINGLDDLYNQTLLDNFVVYLSQQPASEIYLKAYRKAGLKDNRFIKTLLKQYLLKHDDNFINKVLNYDSFVTSNESELQKRTFAGE